MAATTRLRFTTPPHTCGYLPYETASLEYRIHFEMDAGKYGEMIRRGWRRQGVHFFRPACPRCVKCRSLRVDVENFRPSRSQRRALKRNAGVEVVVDLPTVSRDHVRLFNAWHAEMTRKKGWPPSRTTPDDYFASFLAGDWAFDHEFRYYRDGRLAGVGLADIFPGGLSSVYFYYDPAWRPDGPGTFSVLKQIEHAREAGLPWVYLGYWIAECGSMSYKSNFRPHEILAEYVPDGEKPVWLPGDSPHG